MTNLALIDRDGVILQHVDPYILRCEDVAFVPGSIRALRQIAAQGTKIAIVTNQSPVSRGLITEAFVDDVNDYIHRAVGADLHVAFFYCPHQPADACTCRKPKPGMIQIASSHFGVALERAAIIGDHATDVLAGVAAGVPRCARVRSGRSSVTPPEAIAEYDDLLHAVQDGFFSLSGPRTEEFL